MQRWSYGILVPLALALIPDNTKLETNGIGGAFNISESTTRTFFCALRIADQIEQESLDVSIWGSSDGREFGKNPLLKLPQQFYRGVCKMVLDVSLKPKVNFVRAKWELNRWGRVIPQPMFVAGLTLLEIPPMSRDLPTSRGVLFSHSVASQEVR
jgi:hypothetical protein